MGFLNTAILIGLAAGVLPLLIHLFARSRAKSIRFSSLSFLKRLEHRTIRRLKLMQILLLVLRTLAILFLVLAFARPTIRSFPLQPAGGSRTSVVVVFDNSYSLSRSTPKESLLEYGRRSATAVTDLLKPGDEIALVLATDPSGRDTPFYHDLDAFGEQVNDLEIDYRRADLPKAIDSAIGLLQGRDNLNRELYIISDFQASTFKTDSSFKVPTSIRMFALPALSERIQNLAVESVTAVTTLFRAGKTIELEALIRNTGTEPAPSRRTQLYVNGQRVAHASVSVDPGKQYHQPLSFILETPGFMTGRVDVEGDEVTADNSSFFSFSIPRHLSVALVGAASAENPYIELALRPGSRNESDTVIDHLSLEELDEADPSRYDVMILNDISRLSTSQITRLKAYLESGGGLMFVLGDHVDIKAYNNGIHDKLGIPAIASMMRSQQGTFSLEQIDWKHPLFEGMFEQEQPDIDLPEFAFALKLTRSSTALPVISYDSGSPFLLDIPAEPGRILVYTTGFESDLNTFARHPLFAPLITQSVHFLASDGHTGSENRVVGDVFRSRVPAEVLNQSLWIQRPDGQKERVDLREQSSGMWMEYDHLDCPGIYRVWTENRILKAFAVNVEPQESLFTPVDRKTVESLYGMNWVSDFRTLSQTVMEMRFGRELNDLFLILALICLVIEMVLSRGVAQHEHMPQTAG